MTKHAIKTEFKLVKQQTAVMSYLEALLSEVESVDSPTDVEEKDSVTPEALSSTSNHVIPAQTVGEAPLPISPSGPISIGQSCPSDNPTYCGPQWAANKFQMISFNMDGVGYAAPIEKLFGIIPMPKMLTLIPGRKSWFLGLHRNRGINLQVISLSTILNGNRNVDRDLKTGNANQNFILLLDEGRWGFVADSVDNVLQLENKSIKWREDQHTGATVVGTIVENMRVVIDVDALADNLHRGFWG